MKKNFKRVTAFSIVHCIIEGEKGARLSVSKVEYFGNGWTDLRNEVSLCCGRQACYWLGNYIYWIWKKNNAFFPNLTHPLFQPVYSSIVFCQKSILEISCIISWKIIFYKDRCPVLTVVFSFFFCLFVIFRGLTQLCLVNSRSGKICTQSSAKQGQVKSFSSHHLFLCKWFFNFSNTTKILPS